MVSGSATQTKRIAKNLAKKINTLPPRKRAVVLALFGDLGSGKTTFTQGFAEALGVKERVTSPTFVILKKFKIKGPKFGNLIHIDAYRLESPEETQFLDWSAIVKDPGNIVLIEWADRVKKILKKPYFSVVFEHKGWDKRKIDISLKK